MARPISTARLVSPRAVAARVPVNRRMACMASQGYQMVGMKPASRSCWSLALRPRLAVATACAPKCSVRNRSQPFSSTPFTSAMRGGCYQRSVAAPGGRGTRRRLAFIDPQGAGRADRMLPAGRWVMASAYDRRRLMGLFPALDWDATTVVRCTRDTSSEGRLTRTVEGRPCHANVCVQCRPAFALSVLLDHRWPEEVAPDDRAALDEAL